MIIASREMPRWFEVGKYGIMTGIALALTDEKEITGTI